MDLPLAIQFLLCPVVFLALLVVTAPYGRHNRPGWGPRLPSRAAWAAMELPALLAISALALSSSVAMRPQVWVPLLFWVGHYAYRTFVFPALMQSSGRSFPALLVVSAIAFNVLNGYNNAQALIRAGEEAMPLVSWHFMTGAALFLAGFGTHVHSDGVIRNLRSSGSVRYGIPRGGLFRWVSSPNYLGEIVQWTGWAIMTWSLEGLAFALFTFCNLAPRAVANHRWYLERFSDYPAGRRILVPGLF